MNTFARRRATQLLTAGLLSTGLVWLEAIEPRRARAATHGGDQASSAAPRPWRGRRIVDALTQLQAEAHVRIIHSSSLVSETLLVKSEPRAGTPRQIAVEILAPHGLTLKDGPGGIWLVVKLPAAKAGGAPRSARRTPAPATGASTPSDGRDQASAAQEQAPLRSPVVEEYVDVTARAGEFVGQPSVKRLDPIAVRTTAGGFENVFQVLPLLPGVAATDDQGGKLAVRGAGPEHNLIVFDGVQMHSPQRLAEFGSTSFVNPATAANIALDASGLDARHGGRLSSVTVLETRDGRLDRRLAVSGAAGLTNGDLLAEGRLPGARPASWWGTLRGTYYRFVSDRIQEEDVPSFMDSQFKVTLRPTEHTRLTFFGLAGIERMKRPLAPAAEQPRDLVGRIQRESQNATQLGSMNLWWTPSERLTTITTMSGYNNTQRYQDHWRRDHLGNGADFPPGPFDRRISVRDFALRQRAVLTWDARRGLDMGLELRRLDGRWAMINGVGGNYTARVGPDTWGAQRISYDPVDMRQARTHAAAWVQPRLTLGGGIEAEPGLRVDWNSFTGESSLQPRLRVSRRFGGTMVWGGYAWQAQTPGIETMQQGFQFYDFESPDARHVRNERSRQATAGIEQPLSRRFTLRVEAYHRRLDRLLVQRLENEEERAQRLSRYVLPPDMPLTDPVMEYRPTVHPESTGIGRAKGVELLLRRDGGRLSGWASYTWSRSTRDLFGRADQPPVTLPFDFDRPHALAGSLQVQLSRSVRLAVTTQWASGFPITPEHQSVRFDWRSLGNGEYDRRLFSHRSSNGRLLTSRGNPINQMTLYNSSRLQAYARTDVRGTYALGRHWEFYGELLNIRGRDNYSELIPIGDGGGGFGEKGYYARHSLLVTYGIRATF